MKFKVGMIGAGGVSKAHAMEYKENKETELVAISDIDSTARGEFAKTFGLEKSASDYREILKEASIDLIDICLPHFLHKLLYPAFDKVIAEKHKERGITEEVPGYLYRMGKTKRHGLYDVSNPGSPF